VRVLITSCLLLFSISAAAVIENHEFEDDELRLRYQNLSFELRCPKCQNQNIADSNAPIASDLREQLYQQLHAGQSDQQIVDYMVQRYGEFVLYRPRVNKVTLVLWLAPLILLGLALWILLATLRKNRSQAASVSLSEDEQQRVDELLRERGND
jgi:cytochrome c-type biogenesis protein CcmH